MGTTIRPGGSDRSFWHLRHRKKLSKHANGRRTHEGWSLPYRPPYKATCVRIRVIHRRGVHGIFSASKFEYKGR